MKKLKFMPAVLMFIASFAILAIGIYAITPTKNTISGTITINAANTELEITVYHTAVDENNIIDGPHIVRSGTTLDFTSEDLNYVMEGVNELDDINATPKKVVIEIYNKSTTQDLGAYFLDPATTLPTQDDSANGIVAGACQQANILDEMLLDGTEKGSDPAVAVEDILKATFGGYTELPAGEKSTIDITFTLEKFHNTDVEVDLSDFNLNLNIEPLQEDLVPLVTQLKVNSSSETPVSIEVLVDGESVAGGTETTGSSARALSTIAPLTTDIEVSSENSYKIELDDYVFDPAKEDNSKKITLRLTNNSASQSFGAYYYTGTALPTEDNENLGIKAGYADADAIKIEGEVFDRTDGTKIADVVLDTYSYLAKSNTTDNFDVLDMDIYFIPYGTHTTVKTGGFKFALNIEPYVANCTTVTEGTSSVAGTTFNGGLLKVAESVSTISNYAFRGITKISHAVMPNSVSSIGDYAFYYCSGLTSIELPSSLTSIGSSAFYYCNSLTSITIPDGVTEIGENTFYYCSGLTSIELPSSLTSIGSSAFSFCSSLTSITIPEGVTSIGDYAFEACSSLIYNYDTEDANIKYLGNSENKYLVAIGVASTSCQSIKINDNCKFIYSSAFYSCSSLTSITIPEGVTSIGKSAFMSCSGLTSIELPSSLTSIGLRAFSFCSSLTSITIPEGVNSIGDYAFEYCSSLIYNYDTEDAKIKYLGNSENKYMVAIGVASTSCQSIKINDNCKFIYSAAFESCSRLTSITIPEGVTSIGGSVFKSCSGLTSIELPSSLTSIGKSAFMSCSGLTSIELPSSLTSIGDYAFYYCSSLTSITIKSGVDLGSAYTLPNQSKTGYTFEGWYTTEDTSGTKVTQISSYVYTEDTTYYAVFTQN